MRAWSLKICRTMVYLPDRRLFTLTVHHSAPTISEQFLRLILHHLLSEDVPLVESKYLAFFLACQVELMKVAQVVVVVVFK